VARDAAVVEAFRAEIGETVRSAAPLLISMLAVEGWTLDNAVGLLTPPSGWPSRPRLLGPMGRWAVHSHALRHYLAGLQPMPVVHRTPTQISMDPLIGRRFERADGGYLRLQVVDHSLEVEARIGPALIETRFGELSIELDDELPATILVACVGRLVEEIVDFEGWRGHGWRIAAIKDAHHPRGRQRLIVASGAVPYRMPWMR
jgi:hypothetical protein